MPSLERRKWPRVAYRREVVAYAAGRRLSCQAMDLSAGGVCLLPPVQLSPGVLVRLSLGLPGGTAVAVDGVVVREGTLGGRYAWGVRFHRTPARIHQQLVAFIAQERGEDGATPRPPSGLHRAAAAQPTGPSASRERVERPPAPPSGAAAGPSTFASPPPSEVAVSPETDAASAGSYQRIGRGTRERVDLERIDSREPPGSSIHRRVGGRPPSGTGHPAARTTVPGTGDSAAVRSPTGPDQPGVGQRGYQLDAPRRPESRPDRSRWEVSLMDDGARGTRLGLGAPDGDAPAWPRDRTGPAWPAARPEDLSPAERSELARRPTTGSGHPVVDTAASAPVAPPAAPPKPVRQSDPELERELGEELEQLYRAALENMGDPLVKK